MAVEPLVGGGCRCHSGSMTGIDWPVVELRQYTLRPGTRDTLIELFDRELVEPQEALGMRIVGQFRDLGDPDRFVWMRAFRDIAARERALTGFYVDGETWRTHAPAARATMVDTTNALLLRPAAGDGGLPMTGARPGREATALPRSRMLATIYYPDIAGDEFAEFFAARIRPALARLGVVPLGCYLTDPSPNNFAMLPVREESVFAWFARFDSAATLDAFRSAASESAEWADAIEPELVKRLAAPTHRLVLAPTSRSLLR